MDVIYIYTFNTETERYIVEVEHYSHNFYIIKYFPKRLRQYKFKFNILTWTFKTTRIVATCLDIIDHILVRDNLANFGFIGSPIVYPEQRLREAQHNTKRFKIYKDAFEMRFGHDDFTHYQNVASSGYLIINNRIQGNPDDLARLADKMFCEIYPELLQ